MKKLIITLSSIIIFILSFLCISYSSDKNEFITNKIKIKLPKKIVKIFMIHSYNYHHICTAPQRNGFVDWLAKKDYSFSGYDYKFDIQGFYMKTKYTYTSKEAKKLRGELAIKEAEAFNPDFIYTTDDNAFKYAAIPLANKNYKIVFSGINKSFAQYRKENPNMKYLNMCGAEEVIDLQPFFELMDKLNIIFNHIYIITNNALNMTTTSKYKYKNFIRCLNKTIYKNKITRIICTTESDLIKNIKKLNNEPRSLIILCQHRIIDDVNPNNNELGKIDIIKTIIKYNKKHLELDINSNFVKYGLSLSCAPDFYNMGEMAAKNITRYLLTDLWGYRCIKHSRSVMSINMLRINQLGYYKYFKNSINSFVYIFYSIKEK